MATATAQQIAQRMALRPLSSKVDDMAAGMLPAQPPMPPPPPLDIACAETFPLATAAPFVLAEWNTYSYSVRKTGAMLYAVSSQCLFDADQAFHKATGIDPARYCEVKTDIAFAVRSASPVNW